jgi:hypothetical protein
MCNSRAFNGCRCTAQEDRGGFAGKVQPPSVAAATRYADLVAAAQLSWGRGDSFLLCNGVWGGRTLEDITAARLILKFACVANHTVSLSLSAAKFGLTANLVAKGDNKSVPARDSWKLSPDAKYVHYCDNETIGGEHGTTQHTAGTVHVRIVMQACSRWGGVFCRGLARPPHVLAGRGGGCLGGGCNNRGIASGILVTAGSSALAQSIHSSQLSTTATMRQLEVSTGRYKQWDPVDS